MKKNPLLKKAFEEAAKWEIDSLPGEEQIIRPYTDEFENKMKKLFGSFEVQTEKSVPVKRRKVKWAALIAAVMMCLVATFSVSATDLTPKEMLMLMGLYREPDPQRYVKVDCEIKGAYSVGRAEDSHKEVVYDGDDIIIRYIIDEGETSVEAEKGLILFVDGIRQKFTVKSGDESSEDVDMYVIGGNPGTTESIEISFSPQTGKKGEVLALSLASITDPDNNNGKCVSEKEIKDYHFDKDYDNICDDCLVDITIPTGTRSYVLHNEAFAHLIMEEDAPEQKAVCSDKLLIKESPVHKKIRDMFNYEEPSGDGTEYYNEYDKLESMHAVLYKDIDETIYYEDGTLLKDTFILHKTDFTTKGEEKEKFTLNLHGKPGEYRVSLYIGTNPQPVFDGAENIDVTINKGMQAEIDFELDTSKLPEGENRYYIVYKKIGKDRFERGWWWEYQTCEGAITVE